MEFVQPIREKETIRKIERFFKNKNDRDHILFLLGIYTGLRISDILSLKVRDLRGKEYLTIKPQKTRKKSNNGTTIEIHQELKKALKRYLKGKPSNEYVIKSRVGENKAITRERAYMILQEAAKEFDIDSLGCHSMRKTMGYHLYEQKKDLVLVQKVLNHDSPRHTLRYIGYEQDEINSGIVNLKYY